MVRIMASARRITIVPRPRTHVDSGAGSTYALAQLEQQHIDCQGPRHWCENAIQGQFRAWLSDNIEIPRIERQLQDARLSLPWYANETIATDGSVI